MVGVPLEEREARREAVPERRVDLALARLGFDLPERIRDQALEGAPYAMALADRIPRDHGFRDEPGNTWRFPVSGHRSGSAP